MTDAIIKALCSVCSIIGTALPFGIALIKVCKDKKVEKAFNDLRATAEVLIQAAEKTYKDVNDILKSQGSSAGCVKKDTVLTKLQSYAMNKKYKFDADFWSNQIDEIVNLTRKVNAKEDIEVAEA